MGTIVSPNKILLTLGFTGFGARFRVEGLGLGVVQGLYRDNGKDNGNYYLGYKVEDLGLTVQNSGGRLGV